MKAWWNTYLIAQFYSNIDSHGIIPDGLAPNLISLILCSILLLSFILFFLLIFFLSDVDLRVA